MFEHVLMCDKRFHINLDDASAYKHPKKKVVHAYMRVIIAHGDQWDSLFLSAWQF